MYLKLSSNLIFFFLIFYYKFRQAVSSCVYNDENSRMDDEEIFSIESLNNM